MSPTSYQTALPRAKYSVVLSANQGRKKSGDLTATRVLNYIMNPGPDNPVGTGFIRRVTLNSMSITETIPNLRSQAGQPLESWSPADPDERYHLLKEVVDGRLRLTRQAVEDIRAEGPAGVLANLKISVSAATAVTASDRDLYLAAAIWFGTDRRTVFGALEQFPGFAHRVVGYGMHLLVMPDSDPLAAWRPMGQWIFRSWHGWQLYRQRQVLHMQQARAADDLERRSAPWARRFRVLQYLAGDLERPDAQALLELAAIHGGWFTRIRAAGARDQAQERAEQARRQKHVQVVEEGARYPDLIPVSEIRDVRQTTLADEPSTDPDR